VILPCVRMPCTKRTAQSRTLPSHSHPLVSDRGTAQHGRPWERKCVILGRPSPMGVQVRQLGSQIGAEVSGVDVKRPRHQLANARQRWPI
jgi:hypothetical protein